MKPKKILTSKPFIAGTLVVLCVGILVVCLVIRGNNEEGEFVPTPSSTPTPIESWKENPSATMAEKETGKDNNTGDSSKEEEYPKVVETDEEQTVVDFTDPTPEKSEEAPPAPEGKTEIDPGPSHPVQKDPTVTPKPSKQESKPSNSSAAPAPGSKNEKGQVYDPAFGWVTPSKVHQETIDGDGDPNKMVGEMD